MKPERLRRSILAAPCTETYHLDDAGFVSCDRTWHYIDGIQGKYVGESVEQPPTVVPLRT